MRPRGATALGSVVGWVLRALGLAAALGVGAAQGAPPVLHLDTARLHRGTTVQAVRLPHVMAGHEAATPGERLRYALDLTLETAPQTPLGLFIERASRSARLWVNGQEVGGCAPGALEAARCTQRPLWLQVPAATWQAGVNRIEVEVFANPMQLNGLSAVKVGPPEALFREDYRPSMLWRQDLVFAMQWAIFAVGTLILGVGSVTRSASRRLFLWFGLACLLRGAANFYAQSVPLWADALWVQWLFTSARLASIPVMLLALMAFFEQRLPRLERFLVAYALVLPLLTLVTGARTDLGVALALPGVAAAIALIGRLARTFWQDRRSADLLLPATVGVLLALGLHDAWALTSPAGFLRPMALPLANGVLLLVLGGLVLARLSHDLACASDLNTVLAERVAMAQADLRRQHQTLLALERAQARADERERFLRDLHDGLGAHLTTARLLLDDRGLLPTQMRQLLDDCIDDMRLLLDATGPYAQLADAIGSLRYRMTQRLQDSPLRLHWQLALEALPAIDTQSRLQVLRVLQEALTNALRHAQATNIEVQAVYEPTSGQLRLSVRDDGRWTSDPGTPTASPGRGLANMRHRAQALGARFDVDAGPQGTEVRLVWPLPPGPPPPPSGGTTAQA